MNNYAMVPMKRQPTRPHWTVVTYTAQDGRTTNSRDMINAIIDLYGTNVFFGMILKRHNANGTHTHDYVKVYSRSVFRKTGDSIAIGEVSWTPERY